MLFYKSTKILVAFAYCIKKLQLSLKLVINPCSGSYFHQKNDNHSLFFRLSTTQFLLAQWTGRLKDHTYFPLKAEDSVFLKILDLGKNIKLKKSKLKIVAFLDLRIWIRSCQELVQQLQILGELLGYWLAPNQLKKSIRVCIRKKINPSETFIFDHLFQG